MREVTSVHWVRPSLYRTHRSPCLLRIAILLTHTSAPHSHIRSLPLLADSFSRCSRYSSFFLPPSARLTLSSLSLAQYSPSPEPWGQPTSPSAGVYPPSHSPLGIVRSGVTRTGRRTIQRILVRIPPPFLCVPFVRFVFGNGGRGADTYVA